MTTSVHEAEKLSLEQIAAFLQASEEIRFKAQSREQVYHWIEQLLQQQQYEQQGRKGRGLLRRYIARMTGRSRAQVTTRARSLLTVRKRQPWSYRRLEAYSFLGLSGRA